MQMRATWLAIALAIAVMAVGEARAQNIFDLLFGGFRQQQQPPQQPGAPPPEGTIPPEQSYGGGGQAYCVRLCDGRYFPTAATSDREPGSALQRILPGEPDPCFFAALPSKTRLAPMAVAMLNSRTRLFTVSNWSPAAPATARTRSVWSRSMRPTTRPYGRATRWQRQTARPRPSRRCRRAACRQVAWKLAVRLR